MRTHRVELTDRELRALAHAATLSLEIFAPALAAERPEPVLALESAAMKIETTMVMEGVEQ